MSNPYLSQLERGLHEPSVRVLQSIGRALDISAETLLRQAGLADDADESPDGPSTPRPRSASDPRLTDDQKQALLAVYRSYVQANAGALTHAASSSAAHVLAGRVADRAGGRRCPSAAVPDASAPPRSASQRAQSFHHVSRCSVAPARQSSASRGSSSLVHSRAFGPGGFTMPAM